MRRTVVYVFVFRRDLRLHDNAGLNKCVEHAVASAAASGHGDKHVVDKNDAPHVRILPIFSYVRKQADPDSNGYFSSASFALLNACLDDVDAQLPVLRRHLSSKGVDVDPCLTRLRVENERHEAKEILDSAQAVQAVQAVHVYYNRDVTPYARKRDAALKTCISRLRVNDDNKNVHVDGDSQDYTLFPMEEPATKSPSSGQPYVVFSHLYNRRAQLHALVPRPAAAAAVSVAAATERTQQRRIALEILTDIGRGKYDDYGAARNDLTREATADSHESTPTTRLSRYLKFGCVSIREAYWAACDALGVDHALVRELYFREFYYIVAWFRPAVLRGMVEPKARNEAFRKSLDERVPWTDVRPGTEGAAKLEAWKAGRTGTPLVDAGMRQLLATGFMHNRCRMVTAMYLTKDLLIDWRHGERHFARLLVDYDPVQNNAGWQWSASVGNDAAPYFRIFNPYTQQARFDPQGAYVARWVPELREIMRRAVDNSGAAASLVQRLLPKWEDPVARQKLRDLGDRGRRSSAATTAYPDPIVPCHADAARTAKRLYAQAIK